MLKRWISSITLLSFFFSSVPFAHAATIYWNGAGADTQWTTPGNWMGGVAPGTSDIATFNVTSAKNAYIPTNISVSGINVASGYTGIITQSGGSTVTIGTSAFNQAAGTYKGGTGSLADGSGFVLTGGTFNGGLTINGSFVQSGGAFQGNGTVFVNGLFSLSAGTFTAPTGAFAVSGAFQQTGGTFNANNGTVLLIGSGQLLNAALTSFYNVNVNDGLIGHWTFDESSGTTYADTSGLGASFTRYNSPTFSTSVPTTSFPDSHSVQFTSPSASAAAKDYLSLNSPDSYRFSFNQTQDFSVSFFVKTSTGTYFHMIVDNRKSGVGGWDIGINGTAAGSLDGMPWFVLRCENNANCKGSTVAIQSNTNIKDGAWHHLLGVRQGTTASFYVDGILQGTTTANLSFPFLGYQLHVGNDIDNFFPFVGSVDDLRIYDRALNQAEITTLAAGNLFAATTGHTLGAALSVLNNYMGSGGILDVSSSNYGVSVGGNFQDPRGTLNPRSGTVTFNGTGNQRITSTGAHLYAITINKSAGTLFVNNPLSLSGSFLLTAGTFSAPSSLTVSGNFTNRGIFTANNGTVVLNGTNQTLSGSTTFYNLRKVPLIADTLTIGSNSNQAVTGMLTLNGASACALLSLRSATPGLSFGLHPSNPSALSFVDLQDTFNTGTQTISVLGKDSGNNAHIQIVSASCDPSSGSQAVTTTTAGGGGGGGGRAFLATGASKSSVASSSSSSEQASSASSAGSTLFSDVPKDAWFSSFVSALMKAGIVAGYKDVHGNLTGQFKPGNNVTQAEILKMALLAAGKSTMAGMPRNRSARGDWSASYVKAAEDLHLSVYDPSLDIRLPATRGQVIQTVLEAFGIPIARGDNPFHDLPSSSPFAAAIETAATLRIIQGDTDAQGTAKGTVRPSDPINRAEVSKVIVLAMRMLGK